MHFFNRFNYDLGIPGLLGEWKELFSPKYFTQDVIAGITVAFVAIPLSLAIALASGVSPEAGLVTGIIAGIVCALFGGSRLTVSGPAAAMAVLVGTNVEQFGFQGLVIITMVAGFMQLLSGVFGLGRLARYVPVPVIAGFTAGIGVIILLGQLPRAFGLLPPAESDTIGVISHLAQNVHEWNMTCFAIVVTTFVIIRGLPKIFPKVPAILPAVIFSTALVYFFQLKNVPLIGDIPRTLPLPKWPTLGDLTVSELLLNAFTVYLLASLETLLSSTAIDKLTNEKKHDPDQELIGQGLGNMAVALFSGMPVTGVIARSATNVRAGAKTRRASIIHALIILLAIYAIGPWIGLIPVSALAAVLFSVALSMINVKEFFALWKTSRSEGVIYLTTFLTIIFVDLVAGVQVGIAAASVLVLIKAAKTHLHISSVTQDHVIRLAITGPLTFLSSSEMNDLEKRLDSITENNTVLLDLTAITDLDSSGANSIVELFDFCKGRQAHFYMKGMPDRFDALFIMWGGEKILSEYTIHSENELREKEFLFSSPTAYGRLVHGVKRFHAENKENSRKIFKYLATKQDPHTLFITCSDSRIIPTMITSSDPGELFIIRNVGNCIPVYQQGVVHSEFAALDFALNYLNISDVVICAHANCGAIKACLESQVLTPNLQAWIDVIKAQLPIEKTLSQDEAAKLNVLNQIENLKKYPIVQQKLADKTLTLHAWFFHFSESLVYEWNAEEQRFNVVIDDGLIM